MPFSASRVLVPFSASSAPAVAFTASAIVVPFMASMVALSGRAAAAAVLFAWVALGAAAGASRGLVTAHDDAGHLASVRMLTWREAVWKAAEGPAAEVTWSSVLAAVRAVEDKQTGR